MDNCIKYAIVSGKKARARVRHAGHPHADQPCLHSTRVSCCAGAQTCAVSQGRTSPACTHACALLGRRSRMRGPLNPDQPCAHITQASRCAGARARGADVGDARRAPGPRALRHPHRHGHGRHAHLQHRGGGPDAQGAPGRRPPSARLARVLQGLIGIDAGVGNSTSPFQTCLLERLQCGVPDRRPCHRRSRHKQAFNARLQSWPIMCAQQPPWCVWWLSWSIYILKKYQNKSARAPGPPQDESLLHPVRDHQHGRRAAGDGPGLHGAQLLHLHRLRDRQLLHHQARRARPGLPGLHSGGHPAVRRLRPRFASQSKPVCSNEVRRSVFS